VSYFFTSLKLVITICNDVLGCDLVEDITLYLRRYHRRYHTNSVEIIFGVISGIAIGGRSAFSRIITSIRVGCGRRGSARAYDYAVLAAIFAIIAVATFTIAMTTTTATLRRNHRLCCIVSTPASEEKMLLCLLLRRLLLDTLLKSVPRLTAAVIIQRVRLLKSLSFPHARTRGSPSRRRNHS
jgi:hypothetical protein